MVTVVSLLSYMYICIECDCSIQYTQGTWFEFLDILVHVHFHCWPACHLALLWHHSFVSVFQTSVFVVTDTQRVGEHIQHVGYVEKGEIRKGDKLTARINQVNHLVHTWLDVLYIILWNHQKICCGQFSWSINFQFPQNVFLWIYLHDKWISTNCVL